MAKRLVTSPSLLRKDARLQGRSLLSALPSGIAFPGYHTFSVDCGHWMESGFQSVIDVYTSETYSQPILTIVETPSFSTLWPDYWTDDELGEFCFWLAARPDAGEVIRGSGGCRKVRWSVAGRGKRGGVRVIYFCQLEDGEIWLLTMYAKSARESIPASTLRKIRESIHGKDERKRSSKARR